MELLQQLLAQALIQLQMLLIVEVVKIIFLQMLITKADLGKKVLNQHMDLILLIT